MSPESMTDLTITLVLLLVSVGMAFQGKVLKANMADKDAEIAKKIEKKANLLIMCGSLVAIIQVIKLGSFLL
ncbi:MULTISPECIES: hypothetical protein [Pseudoalteromonas]|uniref:HIG1 domain-containing protein n=1 Tax=Pseudoalteromonas obscura TaxID=3048491 RepID=A0ABT7EE51_9GAMM|nr:MULTISPECIES: hypothetical protein [Pseudoalteromonas]MBQ4838505.1 hypothetical protein [Pseudoalteromonas luteoviolacea]MDK2593549.1 hypothetical protein [Pseudoalteromonas sp. P94(2023)]